MTRAMSRSIVVLLPVLYIALNTQPDALAQSGSPSSYPPNTIDRSKSIIPVYKPPVRGAPGGRVGGGTRGGDQIFILSVLAPNHSALTENEQPDLYWYVSKPISTPITFTISDGGPNPVVEQTLAPPFGAGIHRVRLADVDVRLAPGKQYRWFVSLVSDPKRRSRDILAGATIERAEPAEVKPIPSVREDRTGEIGRLAQAGNWYDAIAMLSTEIERYPSEPALRAQRAGLLQQVGLTEIANFDLNYSRQ